MPKCETYLGRIKVNHSKDNTQWWNDWGVGDPWTGLPDEPHLVGWKLFPWEGSRMNHLLRSQGIPRWWLPHQPFVWVHRQDSWERVVTCLCLGRTLCLSVCLIVSLCHALILSVSVPWQDSWEREVCVWAVLSLSDKAAVSTKTSFGENYRANPLFVWGDLPVWTLLYLLFLWLSGLMQAIL